MAFVLSALWNKDENIKNMIGEIDEKRQDFYWADSGGCDFAFT